MFNVKNLSVSFENKPVLDGISVSFKENTVNCILGGSGTGKTTFLNCVANLVPYGGEIDKVKCSYIFQTDRMVKNITVKDNLAMILNAERKNGEKVFSDIKNALKLAGIPDVENKYPDELSGGMLQRVSFVRAFLFESEVVLMDEPFRSLDLVTKKNIADLFFSLLKEYPRTVIFVTHDVEEALFFADRILVLKDCKFVMDENVGGEGSDKTERKFYNSDNFGLKEKILQNLT